MNRLTIDLTALRHNYETVLRWVKGHGGRLTVVTKALCGHKGVFRALTEFGVTSMGDSRIENLRSIRSIAPAMETWYLRPPYASAAEALLPLCDVSLNSELSTIDHIESVCRRSDQPHKIVLMVELGDLREGVLPGQLLDMVEKIGGMPHIDLIGIGANLGCLSGAVPMAEEMAQLCLYHELLELKFDMEIPYVSAGTSAALTMLRDGEMPDEVNHFRVGEAILLGTDPITGARFPGLRDDVVTVEAEIVELKEKRLLASNDTGKTPFTTEVPDADINPGQRGYRAIVTIGHVDTDVNGLVPLDAMGQIAAASSDVTVMNLGEEKNGLSIGDTIAFRPTYAAFVRLMNNSYTSYRLIRTDELDRSPPDSLMVCSAAPATSSDS
jgi:ornithine racemase